MRDGKGVAVGVKSRGPGLWRWLGLSHPVSMRVVIRTMRLLAISEIAIVGLLVLLVGALPIIWGVHSFRLAAAGWSSWAWLGASISLGLGLFVAFAVILSERIELCLVVLMVRTSQVWEDLCAKPIPSEALEILMYARSRTSRGFATCLAIRLATHPHWEARQRALTFLTNRPWP